MRAERPARIVLPPLRSEQAPRRSRGRRSAAIDPAATPGEAALFDALRTHRLELARSLGVPPYVVAHDRTLHGLARERPASLEALLLIDGIGPAKAEKFGQGFLDVVRQHASGHSPQAGIADLLD
jgi:ATP-dependent DNA helicase RecQ